MIFPGTAVTYVSTEERFYQIRRLYICAGTRQSGQPVPISDRTHTRRSRSAKLRKPPQGVHLVVLAKLGPTDGIRQDGDVPVVGIAVHGERRAVLPTVGMRVVGPAARIGDAIRLLRATRRRRRVWPDRGVRAGPER